MVGLQPEMRGPAAGDASHLPALTATESEARDVELRLLSSGVASPEGALLMAAAE